MAASAPGSLGRILLAAAVVVAIVLVAVIAPRVRDHERHLTGFWAGEPAFLAEAGLAEMYLYIAPPERAGGGWRRQGYLVMVDAGGGVVSNQEIELEYGGRAGRWGSALRGHFGGGRAAYQIPAVRVSYDEEAVMPEELRLGLDAAAGTLALYSGEKLYAALVRDNETSAAVEAERAEADEADEADEGARESGS